MDVKLCIHCTCGGRDDLKVFISQWDVLSVDHLHVCEGKQS